MRLRGALILGLALVAVATAASAVPWNVGDSERPGQWTIYNRVTAGAGLGLPVASGDVNGDGRADVILTPMNADGGPNHERMRSGEAAIVLSSGVVAGMTDLALVDVLAMPSDVTLIFGSEPLDFLGTQVAVADLDADGFGDTILGAQNADGPSELRNGAGEVIILWGSAAVGGQAIDLASLPRPDVTRIFGAGPGDRLGVWVASGDFDGDGVTDAILGADQASGPDGTRAHAGSTYVLYGGSDLRAHRDVDLAAADLPATVVYGVESEDHSGSTARGADVNRDGADDLLIGAGVNRLSSLINGAGEFGAHGFAGGDGPADDRPEAGEAYVVFGQAGLRPASIDLAAAPASTVVIYGADPGDAYGEEVGAGDFNGDGHRDVVLGALTAAGPENARPNAGEVALILGGPSLSGSAIDLASPGANVIIFQGAVPDALAGDTVFLVDLDGDGCDELVIGSPGASPGKRGKAGLVTIVFGTAEPLPRHLDLAALPTSLAHVTVEGGQVGDILAYSGAHGDVDDDGVQDLIFNGMGGDGFGDLLPAAGEAYVLSGLRLAEARLTPCETATVDPTATTTPSATAPAAATPTSTETATETATATHPATPTPSPLPTATGTTAPPPPSGGGCAVDPRGGAMPSPVWIVLLVLLSRALRSRD